MSAPRINGVQVKISRQEYAVKKNTGLIERARPIARTKGLVIEELEDEILIYDTERHKAHCLNSTAAWTWELCDGRRSVEEIERTLALGLPFEATREVVWSFLAKLDRLHLLEEGSLPLERHEIQSRRELLRNAFSGSWSC